MSTGIGAAVALFIKKTNMKILSFSLGLSAGVMVYISFMELLPDGMNVIGNGSIWLFFSGMAIPGFIDLTIPEPFLENGVMNGTCSGARDGTASPPISPGCLPSGSNGIEDVNGNGRGHGRGCGRGHGPGHDHGPGRGFKHRHGQGTGNGGNGLHLHRLMFARRKLVVHSEEEHKKMTILRSGIMTAIAITIHNVPEGMATFSSTIHDVNLGLLITFAIIIHNIPEGVSTAMPIFCATNNRKKAFYLSFLSGLAEPAGALLCAAILLPFLNDTVIAGLLAVVAGIMVYISFDEILPTAHKYGNGHVVILGVVAGMAVMSISLLKF
ncbi:MAG: ZIP family metal transporter [Candidatus Lokiarchaeota archaeon]|nr:ZIP family metal transporter [Candidatus Lokiarchaeota archaeon]